MLPYLLFKKQEKFKQVLEANKVGKGTRFCYKRISVKKVFGKNIKKIFETA
jgi:hypothetical protein